MTPAPVRRRQIGLTGNIATGKSLVLGLLVERGACGIDGDAVYHSLISPGTPLLAAIAAEFGAEFLTAEGGLDRQRLGQLVFANPAALARLDALTHPAVVAAVRAAASRQACPVTVIDAVKLVESGLGADCDEVWLVVTDQESQLARLMARNRLSRDQASQRIAAQPADAARRATADVVIDNSGSIAATVAQVEAAFAAFRLRFGLEST